jgi:Uma2 family endonuclease
MTWTTLLIALQRHLFASLRKLLAEQNRDWFVGYEQKMLLDAKDQRIGVVPDLYVLPCQPKDPNFFQWPAYLPDVPVPVFALEVVSGSNWDKDYQGSPQRYAKLGVEELLLFDPLALEGKSPASPPYALQLYRRGKKGELKRVYAGEGPVWSEEMRVWFRVEGSRLTVTRDREGTSAVLTAEETERWWDRLEEERAARKSAEEQTRQERQAKEAAELQAQAAEQQAQAAERQAQAERKAKEAAELQAQAARQRLQAEREAKEAAERQVETATQQVQVERQAKEAAELQAKAAEQQALQEAREAITDLCDVLAIRLTPDRLAHLASLDLAALRDLRALLKLRKTWPD